MSAPALEIRRAADLRPVPWKNGGGTTTAIAARPRDAAVDDFDWRVSLAQIARAGPFSAFPGIDRTLSVVSGSGLVLEITGRDPVTLSVDSQTIAFPGDSPTEAHLTAGPITALNVMTRRGRFRHAVLPIARPDEHRLAAGICAAILVSLGGRTGLDGLRGRDGIRLGDGDAAVIEPAGDGTIHVSPSGMARARLVLLLRSEPQAGCG